VIVAVRRLTDILTLLYVQVAVFLLSMILLILVLSSMCTLLQ